MKLKELPPHVRKVALERAKDEWEGYTDSELLEFDLSCAFVWDNTPEKNDIWHQIYFNQNYEPFNNFHKIKK